MTARRDEDGAAAVELALVLPLLLTILAVVVDLGVAFVIKAQIQEAAEEAAVYAARYPTQFANAKQRAVDAVTYTSISTSEVNITCASSGMNREVTVSINRVYTPLVGIAFPNFTISADVVSDFLSDEAQVC